MGTTPMSYTNTGSDAVNIYFVFDGYDEIYGDFSLRWEITTLTLTDLSTISSPYDGSPSSSSDHHQLSCGSSGGAESAFYMSLPAGAAIDIGLTSTSFDSRHELSVGGAFPGDTSVGCVPGNDHDRMSYTNTGSDAVNIYFVVDAHSSWSGDLFTLTWEITTSPTPTDLSTISSPYFGSITSSTDHHQLSCGSSGGRASAFYMSLPAGATINIRDRYGEVGHELSVGGAFPGDTSIGCVDYPDTTPVSYTNTGSDAVNIYFVFGGYDRGNGGFDLTWEVSSPSLPSK